VWAIVVKEFRELRRDRRTVAMLVVLPLLFLIIFGYAASFDVDTLRVDVYGPGAESVEGQLPELFDVGDVEPDNDRDDAVDTLRRGRTDAVVVADPAAPEALIDGSSLFTAQAANATFNSAESPVVPTVLFNPDLTTSWVMVPALIGLIMAFIGTIITSLGLVRERQAGTLEQLAVMPFRPSDVILGKIVPYFVIGFVDMAVVTVLGVVIFGVPFEGSVAILAAAAAIFLLVVLGFGVLISTVSQNQGQAIQMAIFILLPQVLLSGMIFPLESMPWGVRWIGYVLPLTYFIELSRGVMLRAAPLDSLALPFAALTVMAIVVLGLAIMRFRRDLAPDIDGTGPTAGAPA
jgi:ABC-2 type transport system permease protein